MSRRYLFILALCWRLASGATWGTWNGVTVGSSGGNISKWNGATIGTAATNLGSWNGLASPGGGGAWTMTGQTTGSGTGTGTVNFTIPAGTVLVFYHVTHAFSSITSALGNTIHTGAPAGCFTSDTNQYTCGFWSIPTTTGADTITVNPGGSLAWTLNVASFGGTALSTGIDLQTSTSPTGVNYTTNIQPGTQSGTTAGGISPATSEIVVTSVASTFDTPPCTIGEAYTVINGVANGSFTGDIAWKTLSGATNPTWTCAAGSGGFHMAAAIFSFK